MTERLRKAIESEGYGVGDFGDFLGLTEEERIAVGRRVEEQRRMEELRGAVSAKVKELRQRRKLTQGDLATLLKSSQPRVAKIESTSADVSLDLMFRGLFALGGNLEDLVVASDPQNHAKQKAARDPKSRPKRATR
jgi:DNA-binding XRE family transcriptional regulator